MPGKIYLQDMLYCMYISPIISYYRIKCYSCPVSLHANKEYIVVFMSDLFMIYLVVR